MDNRPTIAEVQEWVLKLYNTCEQTITSEERKEQHKYGVSGFSWLVSFLLSV